MSNKQGKMVGYINYRMRIMVNDGRTFIGQMLAFDKHMNLVINDTEEFRRIKRKQRTQTVETEEKRMLGLVILRGSNIISVSVESPPPSDPSARLGKPSTGGIASSLSAGPGVARPAGRGAPPTSLAGPAAGVGGGAPPGFPHFPGAPGFGRGGMSSSQSPITSPNPSHASSTTATLSDSPAAAAPPGFPPGFAPPPGFPGMPMPPHGFPPGGGPPGGGPPGGGPPGFNPPPRR